MTMPNSNTMPSKGFIFSNKLYDKAKWLTLIFLPALSTFYFALSGIWGLPYTTQVIGTIAAITTFSGVLLGLSTRAYNGGEARYGGAIDVETNEAGTKVFSLNLNGDPNELELLPEVTFKINKSQ